MSGTSNTGRSKAAAMRRWLASEKVRNSMGAALISLLVSVAGTSLTNHLHDRDDQLMKERSAFIDEARTFDGVIANYVQTLLDNKRPSNDALEQVLGNIIRQSNLLNDADKQLSLRDKQLAVDYKKLLVKFRDDLPGSDNVLHMRTFWEDASRILVARNELISKLQ